MNFYHGLQTRLPTKHCVLGISYLMFDYMLRPSKRHLANCMLDCYSSTGNSRMSTGSMSAGLVLCIQVIASLRSVGVVPSSP